MKFTASNRCRLIPYNSAVVVRNWHEMLMRLEMRFLVEHCSWDIVGHGMIVLVNVHIRVRYITHDRNINGVISRKHYRHSHLNIWLGNNLLLDQWWLGNSFLADYWRPLDNISVETVHVVLVITIVSHMVVVVLVY